jgi:hypothetical protein
LKHLACLSGALAVTLLACGAPPEADTEPPPLPSEEAALPTETLVPVASAWSYLEPGFVYGGNRRTSVVAVDRLGNSYVLASFNQAGVSRSSLIAFDPTGQRRWRRDFSAALEGSDGELDVSTDFWGNVFIVGSSVPQLDLGGGPLGKRAFVAKFSSTGGLLWQRPLCDSARVSAVTTDAYGAVWFGGTVGNGCNMGGGPLWELTQGEQGFIAKFDALGEYVFSRAIGGRGDSVSVRDLTVTSDNGVVVVGGRYVFAESSQIRPYISKFASNGPHRWFRDYPEAYGDFWGAEVDGGRIVVVGTYSLNLTFKGVNHPASGLYGDGLVLAYTESGGEDWIQRLGCWAKAVSARAGKVAVLASSCSRPLPFPESVDVAGKDGVLALYQGNGTPVRVRGIGQWHSSGWDVALSPLGAATVTGNENIQADSSGYRTDLSVFSLMP